MNKEITSREQDTTAFKFKVDMVVSLFAENEEQAAEQLDAQGGFIISRNVELIEATPIHTAKDEKK